MFVVRSPVEYEWLALAFIGWLAVVRKVGDVVCSNYAPEEFALKIYT